MPSIRWVTFSSTTPITTKTGPNTAPIQMMPIPLVCKNDARLFTVISFGTHNAFANCGLVVVEFWGEVAKPPQNGA